VPLNERLEAFDGGASGLGSAGKEPSERRFGLRIGFGRGVGRFLFLISPIR
jgi:hypothetical protein